MDKLLENIGQFLFNVVIAIFYFFYCMQPAKLDINRKDIMSIEIINTMNKRQIVVITDSKNITKFYDKYLKNVNKELMNFVLEYEIKIKYGNGDIKTIWLSGKYLEYEGYDYRMKNNFDDFLKQY